MSDLLCDFAHRFPVLAAKILQRDRGKRRNFREETITDVLMAGLTAFEPFGISVDFPADESKTGDDMDWEFVDPKALDGRRYLRLHIQAKRAILSKGKKNPYWFYRELDHAVPKGALKGSQHKLLVDSAKPIQGCVPLYAFYHPQDALEKEMATLPAVEGVNVIFADQIPQKLSLKHWPIADKKVAKWRPYFMPLSKLLCFKYLGPSILLLPGQQIVLYGSGFTSPGELADRLNALRARDESHEYPTIQAVQDIPLSTLRALDGRRAESLAEIERPRVIFRARSTGLDPSDE